MGHILRHYFTAWFGMMILAIVNGVLRDVLYKPHVGDLAAHQISTIILLAVFAAYFHWLMRKWRLKSARQAWMVGGMWLLMTIAFEVLLGYFGSGRSWSEILAAYNLMDGRLWVLIPLWTLIGPYVFFRSSKE